MNVSFIFPNFLWMSFLALVPFIIHLINLRKHKVVYFSDISLLKSIQSTSNSSKKVKNWLILLMRMLMIVFLSVVFAQPYIPNPNQKFIEGKSVAIYIDTSPSMVKASGLTNCISNAKLVADEIIQSYPQGTLFKILTSENLNQAQFPNNASRAKDIVAQSAIGSYRSNFNNLYKRIVKDEDIQAIHIVSDFLDELDTNQFNFLPFSVNYYPVQIAQSLALVIDSVYFDSPIRKLIGEEELKISSLVQGVQDSVNVKTNVIINKVNYFTSSNLSTKSTESKVVFPVVNERIVKGTVKNEFTDAVSNQLYWAYAKKEKIKVLLISNETEIIQTLQKIYQTEDLIDLEVVSEQKADFTQLNLYDLVILGGLNQVSISYAAVLHKYMEQNKVVCIIPSTKINISNYNQFYQNLQVDVIWSASVLDTLNASNLDVKHYFFNDIFKDPNKEFGVVISPKVFQYYTVQINAPQNNNLIELNNQNPWLSLQNNCFTFTSNIVGACTNLKQHPLIVALFLKMAMFGAQHQNLYYPIHQNAPTNFTIKNYPQLKIKSPNSTVFNWNSNNLGIYTINNQFNEVGFYEVLIQDSVVDVLAVNIPSQEYIIQASSFMHQLANVDNVIDISSSGSINLSEIQQGKKISIYFIWILLILLLIENVILFKTVR
jgi:hypothetical protein